MQQGVNVASIPWLFNKDALKGEVYGERPIDVTFMASKEGRFYPYRKVLYEATLLLKERGYNVVNTQNTVGHGNWELATDGPELHRKYIKVVN